MSSPSPSNTPAGPSLPEGASPYSENRPLFVYPGDEAPFHRPRYMGRYDRFIPASVSVESYRVGSPASSLTGGERIYRRTLPSTYREQSSSPERAPSVAGSGPATNIALRRGVVGTINGSGHPAPRSWTNHPTGRMVDGQIASDREDPAHEAEMFARRLAAALGLDRASRVLNFHNDSAGSSPLAGPPGMRRPMPGIAPPRVPGLQSRVGLMGFPLFQSQEEFLWEVAEEDMRREARLARNKRPEGHRVPEAPFRVLDAPGLRDDYYCSLLAYLPEMHALVVGLNCDVYTWTESRGAAPANLPLNGPRQHVTALAVAPNHNILAIGRIDGLLSLWDVREVSPRLEKHHPAGIACLTWRPKRAHGSSFASPTAAELLVGDEMGTVFYYVVEWENPAARTGINHPPGMAGWQCYRRLLVHSQQLCGIAWSPCGMQFATGGNDNMAYIFDYNETLAPKRGNLGVDPTPRTIQGGERYRLPHGAAVKALAFCPWQRGLLATGGGSNDRCIHFFHTLTGVTIATISVSAQVTSLIWSTTSREIAATFGYANPDHRIRIAVFSYPECRMIQQIAWPFDDMRALYAVAYPGGPDTSEGSSGGGGSETDPDEEIEVLLGRRPTRRARRARVEGCLVIARSDETVRFHEVWSSGRGGVLEFPGLLGSDEILDGMEGIEGESGETIR